MRKLIRRVVAMTFVILLLCSLFPFSCFAVDPVSAATMANALAQAITAYGASNGVSMMYDVTSTDGIGEAMHDLWGQFKADVNDNNVPTYDSLAVTIWSTVFKKVGNNVGINLSSTTVSYMDKFWNWLLSGPAEMTKVDNQYYEWTLNQSGSVDPIRVISLSPFPVASVVASNVTWSDLCSQGLYIGTFNRNGSTDGPAYVGTTFSGANVYVGTVSTIGQYGREYTVKLLSFDSSVSNYSIRYCYTRLQSVNSRSFTNWGSYYIANAWTGSSGLDPVLPDFSSESDFVSAVQDYLQSGSPTDSLSVAPYVGDAVPGDVHLPDTDDPDYGPLPYVGPLNYPWQSAWGDGDTITDAQGQSITGALDNAISEDGTLELEGDDVVDPPAGDQIGGPDSYQVPGLADVFPFCIPFDIYNFLAALAAEPTAPYFEATLAFPEAIGGTQTIEIDFDTPTWNQLAQLLRLLELLAFIVGLALLTRSMFIRG